VDDIPVLSEYFLNKYAARNRKEIKGISLDAQEKLMNYSWPGNVRELENVIERAVIVAEESIIKTDDLLLSREKDRVLSGYKGKSLKEAVNLFKKNYIKRILGSCGNNQTDAAARLGIQRTYLSRLIKDLDIKI